MFVKDVSAVDKYTAANVLVAQEVSGESVFDMQALQEQANSN